MPSLLTVKNKLSRRQLFLMVAVLLAGAALALLILRSAPTGTDAHDEGASELASHDHGGQAAEIARGPHGGKLFSQDGYAVEVSIFEQNVAPQFRLYTYLDGQPLDPALSSISLQLERLGRTPKTFAFSAQQDYLQGNAEVVEPHSFKVEIRARYQNKDYQFAYEQVEARVDMTDKQLALNAIEVLTAGPARIKSTLQLIGEIKLNADKSVRVVSRLGGIVQAVNANAGDQVKAGQLLAVISSQSIADQRSELLAAQKRSALARITYEREKKLWEEKISAEQDYLQARQVMQEADISLQQARQKLQALGVHAGGVNLGNNSDLTRFEIRAPIAGMVTSKQIATGQVMTGSETVFVVADLSTVWAEMSVYAKDINTVKVGQPVTVKASAFDAAATGNIAYVGALVGEQSRTAMARVVLPNAKHIWLPGLPVNIELTAEEVAVPLAISVEGIQSLRDWTVVFARYGQEFEARPLTTGRSDAQYIEVLSGLQPGERYAAGNSFLVKAELGKTGASHDH